MIKLPQKNFFKIAILFFTISSVIQCNKDKSQSPEIKKKEDSLATAKKDALIRDSIKKKAVVYHSFIFPQKKKDSAMAAFNDKFSKNEQSVILALNRLDLKNKWRADTLMIPDKIEENFLIYSPFPASLEKLKEVNKIVFFSYPIQAYSLYENGKLVKWGPTSMGKKSAQTKRGLMFANWKKELSISTVSSEWKLPYNFNVHNTLGIGWHQYDLPGYPASHSCLRLSMDDAKFLYNWADQWILNKSGATVKANGTPVIVFGDYHWVGKKPWKNLDVDAKSNNISVEEMNAIFEPDLAKILEEQKKRESVITTQNAVQPAA